MIMEESMLTLLQVLTQMEMFILHNTESRLKSADRTKLRIPFISERFPELSVHCERMWITYSHYNPSESRTMGVVLIDENAEIARQEVRLKIEQENLKKERSVLMGIASNQDNQDGALEITVSSEKYRCLKFAKAKK